MIPKLKRLALFATLCLLMISGNGTSSFASTPGTVPFAFFKAIANYFSAIGGYVVSTGGFVTNTTIVSGNGDGVFGLPTGVAYDSIHNAIYVLDYGSYRVLKLNATNGAFIGAIGNISSSTGTCPSTGPAPGWCTGGSFVNGAGDGMFAIFNTSMLTYDSTNDALYIADRDNNRIVKVTASTGAFVGAIGKTTSSTGTCPNGGTAASWCTGGVFSNGTADGQFHFPDSLVYDSTNNALYIADQSNARIVKINAASGAFVGSIGNLSSSSGSCPASGAASGWCTGGVFVTGTGDGMLSFPSGVAYDSTHDALYIADQGNFRIVKVTATTGAFFGAIGTTSSSSGTCPASGVASGWCTGGVFAGTAGDGMYPSPDNIAYDSTNNALYVTDFTNRISKVTASTGAFVGSIGKTTSSSGSCPASGAAPGWCTGGTFTSGAGDGMFNFAIGIIYDSTHNAIYIADLFNRRLVKVTATTGAFVGAAGGIAKTTTGWGTLTSPSGGNADGEFSGFAIDVAYDSTHDAIYVLDNGYNKISKFTASTGVFVGAIGNLSASTGTCPASGPASGWCTGGTFASGSADGAFWFPYSIAYDSVNNAIYVAEAFNSRVDKFNAATGSFVGAIGGLSSSTGTCPASGAAPGWCTGGSFGGATGDGTLLGPSAVAYDATNNALYIGDQGKIVKVTATTGAFVGAIGNVTSSTGSCPASGAAPGWCTGGTFTNGSGDGMFDIYRLGYDPTNNAIYVAEQSNQRVTKVTATTGAFVGSTGNLTASTGTCPASGAALGWCTGGTFSGAMGDGKLRNPTGVAYDSTNNSLYITDGFNNRVVKVSAPSGAFIGAIGKTTSSTGTCPSSGTTNNWCTGGVFSNGSGMGMFATPIAVSVDTTNNALYIVDSGNARIIKKSPK